MNYLVIFIICVLLTPTELKPVKTRKTLKNNMRSRVKRMISNQDGNRDDVVEAPNRFGLNGYERTSRPELDNMFRLPKPPKARDTITITGVLEENKQWLEIYLTEGTSEADVNNAAFYIKIDFTSNAVDIGSIDRGNFILTQTDEEASNYTDEEFNIILTFDQNGKAIHPILNSSSMATITFNNTLENISFISTKGNIKVKELKFEYS